MLPCDEPKIDEKYAFISYSRDDQGYVDDLIQHLNENNVAYWVDTDAEHGDNWPTTIRERVDNCSVMILVMTDSAEKSNWVTNEVLRAKEKDKQILPLLLSGKELFMVNHLNHEDVTNQRMPSERYTNLLIKLTKGRKRTPKQHKRPTSLTKRAMLLSVALIPLLVFALIMYRALAPELLYITEDIAPNNNPEQIEWVEDHTVRLCFSTTSNEQNYFGTNFQVSLGPVHNFAQLRATLQLQPDPSFAGDDEIIFVVKQLTTDNDILDRRQITLSLTRQQSDFEMDIDSDTDMLQLEISSGGQGSIPGCLVVSNPTLVARGTIK